MTFEILLITSIILDLPFGDPRWYPHPVKILGHLLTYLERICRFLIPHEKTAGCVTAIFAVVLSAISVAAALSYAGRISQYLQIGLAVLLLYSLIAIKDLLKHSRAVYDALVVQKDLALARIAVGRIVGRDTQHLDITGVSRACVETVAENMVDGITAPLFWAILFSLFSQVVMLNSIVLAAVGMTVYKTINTMDSMFGYKNTKYYNFGWAPARLDDLAGFVPARLSGLAIIVSAWLLRYDGANSWLIFFRDRNNHSSPNAGHTEAAIAGALNLRLGGPANYFGEVIEKPFIGNGEDATANHILQTHKIIFISSSLFFFFMIFLRNICI